jgi:hypothetical protein
VILSSRTWSFKENRRLDGFAVGAILPPPERGDLPRTSDQINTLTVSMAIAAPRVRSGAFEKLG